jgi:N-acylneuraminate cytidylyltransferase
MYYSDNGEELKKFNTKDGMGISLVQKQGIVVGIIT